MQWARRSRIESFVTLQRRIAGHREQILAAIEHGLFNGLARFQNTSVHSPNSRTNPRRGAETDKSSLCDFRTRRGDETRRDESSPTNSWSLVTGPTS
ncbi:hypothetical protein [Rhodococcus sp. 1163]|uniref:hypothetical protein n=1 Tax=Rhodococcus sp. 1163 TaxID=1905289 RepID=UPI00356B6C03